MPGNDLTLEEIEAIVAQSAWKPPEYFVYFDIDSGDISSINNYIDESSKSSFIKVNFAEVHGLLYGKEAPSDYRVVLDFKTNEYILQNVAQEGIRSFNWSEEVYQIPKLQEKCDLHLIQDKNQGTWTLEISEKIKMILAKQTTGLDYNLAFYSTKTDDVNILYGIIKFPVKKLLPSGTCTIDSDSARLDTSVYCRKIFDFYSHKEL